MIYSKSKRLKREAGEWEEKAENELKQEVGRTSLRSKAIFQALAEKGASRRESEMGWVTHLAHFFNCLIQSKDLGG